MEKIKKIKLVVILCFCVLGACARLDYIKVPTPTQYSNWTDEDQRKADAMKGVRYYLPRPFLHLKKSIPVAQRVAFISFHFDPKEGTYVLDPPEDPPTWLERVVPRKISVGQALAATLAKTRMEVGKLEEGEVGPEEAPPAEAEVTEPPSTLTATTGFINQSDPVTELSDKMDIVYLPDFEEQYVIRPQTGLGEANIETRLRNGWAAEVFSVDLDNSQVIPYVIEQVEKASEVAAGIATTWMPVAAGLPPGTSPAALIGAEMEAGEVERDLATRVAENVLGQILLFKIAEVRVAQPGVYPILKPREIKQWLKYDGVVIGGDPQASFEQFLVQAKLPWIRPDMAFIPCPPFTMIGFNATTDVFLAPATDRGLMTGPATDASDNRTKSASLNEQKMAIAKAMEEKNIKLDADKDLISQQNIKVDENTAGNGTVITISTPPTATFTSNKDAIRKWIIEVFNLNDQELADNGVTLKDNGNSVEINILVNIPDLAERAKKVE